MTSRILWAMAGAMFASAFSVTPAAAESLLGGVIGDGDSGALVTLEKGEAGTSGTVNLGLDGGGGNVVDANIGHGLANANVSSGGDAGTLDVDATIGRQLLDIDVGSDDSLLDAEVDIGNGTVTADVGAGTDDELLRLDMGLGGGNGGSSPGAPSPGPGPVGGGSGIAPPPGIAAGDPDDSAIGAVNCSGEGADPGEVLNLFHNTQLTSWTSASSIEIVPVGLCASARSQVASYLAGQGKYGQLQGAVSSDALISTALGRTSYGTDNVFAVQRSGQRLTVYVY